ncbi:hypothetical protein [Burkholderia ambifaria]|uniref:hypothetical protein n=1 Tax=Burkholderia ambifaria TaxID=152480 RepID=UPI001589AB28|nr:hypothetical protein [Burkholderia ambifaria]
MNPFGIVSESDTRTAAHKPPFIPSFGFVEVHESRPIDAPPSRIIDAVATLDMRADPVIDALRNRAPQAARERFGFDTFTLLHRDDTSLSLGLVGRFWHPTPDVRTIADAAAFVRHDDPHDAKLVLRFEVIGLRSGMRLLRTETFVHCPSARTRLLFLPYWLAIRLGSGWIRRRTLAAVEMALA